MAPPRFPQATSTAWLYMMDGDSSTWPTIPDSWKQINFGQVDVLILAPLGLQNPADGTFGVADIIVNRFQWAVQTAKAAPRMIPNTKITILVSQFWGSDPQLWGHPLSALPATAIDAHANSVRDFISANDLDGYDIDYEPNNIVATVPAILQAIRAQLDDLSLTNGGRPYYTTVSPAELMFLDQAVPSLSAVNMQSYSGGIYITVADLLKIGFQPAQILYGVNAESPGQGPTVQQALDTYKNDGLVGIHLWRLNSGDFQQEIEWQSQVFDGLHCLSN
ncbi:glycoside hydrolase superfamily [Apodospora peruviana]|uniref:Glycoside hydrolase superfamily n=1 Tax=Apodospora peruviana TaxID=516989 RepID=A0AAE0HZB6_9PEZI|nr:glycoside hydrolase superfamily [Apodospora peruviana]